MNRVALAVGLLAIGLVPLTLGALLVRHRSGGSAADATLVPQRAYRGTVPPAGIRSPDFRLKSYRGAYVGMRGLRGKVVLVTFLDTKCTTQCPLIATILGEAIRQLPGPAKAKTVAAAISVDPKHDTPESARRFLGRRHALGALDFLIGTTRQLRPVWQAFHVLAVADTGNANIHSADVRVFDRRGVWVSTLHVGVDLTAANVVNDVETALKEETS
jgi:cytochrome oxidase Cu insertion factor (SCO1/SenC/PrrC family)